MTQWSLETEHSAKTHHTSTFYLKRSGGGGDYCVSYEILTFVRGPTTGTIGAILEHCAEMDHPAKC